MTAAKHASTEESIPTVYGRIFDENNIYWQENESHNKIYVQCQMNYANDKLRARGHIFLNEIYDILGFERSSAGALVGWLVQDNEIPVIDFGDMIADENGRIALEFNVDGVIYDKI